MRPQAFLLCCFISLIRGDQLQSLYRQIQDLVHTLSVNQLQPAPNAGGVPPTGPQVQFVQPMQVPIATFPLAMTNAPSQTPAGNVPASKKLAAPAYIAVPVEAPRLPADKDFEARREALKKVTAQLEKLRTALQTLSQTIPPAQSNNIGTWQQTFERLAAETQKLLTQYGSSERAIVDQLVQSQRGT